MPTLSGKNVQTEQAFELSLTSGTPTVLVFLSARCPCSQDHEEALARLAKSHGTHFNFVGIVSNPRESDFELKRHFGSSPIPFAVIRDRGLKYANEFGAVRTPHAFVFDGNGELLYRGGIDDSHEVARAKNHYLAQVLHAVGSGKESPFKEKRVLGCNIR